MLNLDNLNKLYRDVIPKANDEFLGVAQCIDQMLLVSDGICLWHPVTIYGEEYVAVWAYKTMPTEDELDDYGDGEPYPFNCITLGLRVTKKRVSGKEGKEIDSLCLTTFIGDPIGEAIVYLTSYELADELDLVKISDHIATVAATIRALEKLIITMKPEQRKIAMSLVSSVTIG